MQGTSKSPQMVISANLPNFEANRQWTKDISPIRGYQFMKLYQYLINSTESMFDQESMSNAYVAKMRSLGHKDLQCKMTGLTLLPCHSYLGASSDG